MAYNLPPPWDPGYALPDNVRDEGLERRGFVTKQMPRGTYDQPDVGTGGYVVPQYVMDEGYGQGTFTTKWEPRGQYDGGRIPYWLNARPKLLSDRRRARGGRALTIAAPVTVMPYGEGSAVAMSGDAPPQDYATYGAQAAATIIARVAQLPAGQRTAALKQILQRIDRTLWNRTAAIARELVAGGMPTGPAFRQALARALAAGLAAEVIRTGQSRTAPQSDSLLGLGCARGRMAALGGADTSFHIATDTSFHIATNLVTCPGYSWDGAGWVRTKVGAADTAGPAGGCPVTVVHPGGATSTVSAPPPPGQMMSVGPFSFPTNVTRIWTDLAGEQKCTWTPADPMNPTGPRNLVCVSDPNLASIASAPDITVHDPAIIPTAWRKWMQTYLTADKDADGLSDTRIDYLKVYKTEADATPWFAALGINREAGNTVRAHALQDLHVWGIPVAKFKHPITGENIVIKSMLDRIDRRKPWDANTNPLVLKVWIAKVPDPSFLKRVFDAIISVVATLRDVVVGIVEAVADLACQMIQSPNAVAAGAAAGGAAGAAGTAIVKTTICKPEPPPPPPPPPGGSGSILPLAILGGGALLAVVLLGKKKGPSTP